MALYAAIILLLPMACFFLSSPTFLLVSLEVPEVRQLLRGIFHGYFLAIGIAGTIAAVLFAASGRAVFSLGAIAVAVFAVAARRWLLQRMDAQLRASDGGVAAMAQRLRVLHVKGMLINAVQFAAVVACVPQIV
jgi:hypothetical protein